MKYNIHEIKDIVGGTLLCEGHHLHNIENIVFDSRKISFPSLSLFVALTGNSDGHNYLNDAYKKGIRNFLVSKDVMQHKECNVLLVEDVMMALQKLAEHHRAQHQVQTIGITGSNGKTIVKEWLTQLLSKDYETVKSPKSYNSQLGVPLSVLQLDPSHEIAVFEAGISTRDEMVNLEKIIKPDIGIICNIGDAHSAGFENIEEKLAEKLLLFKDSSVIIYNREHLVIHTALQNSYSDKKLIPWGYSEDSHLRILDQYEVKNGINIKLLYNNEIITIFTSFKDSASIENLLHVITTACFLDVPLEHIKESIVQFSSVPLRFEIERGRKNSFLINDSYSIDMASLKIALEYLDKQADGKRKILVFTDFDHQTDKDKIISESAKLINDKKIDEVITVGYWIDQVSKELGKDLKHHHYHTTESLLESILDHDLQDAVILIKGARRFNLEKLFNKLSALVHQTILEINLSHLSHNIKQYRAHLKPETKLMAVIKASAYGSGATELAGHLSNIGLDYLAVALADEGAALRKSGIKTPILVFNPQDPAMDLLWEFDLEPEVYSLSTLKKLSAEADRKKAALNIHIKLDSGMRRLGLLSDEINEAISIVQKSQWLNVVSVFSHLSASEDKEQDAFTFQQFEAFDIAFKQFSTELKYKPIRHILNSAGILRFPERQYEMVRIGMGMYGINEAYDVEVDLLKVHTLKSTVLQIKELKQAEATGYGRDAIAENDMKIAIVGIGYADGLMRNSGHNFHYVLINGKKATILGNVCMDVCIVDISKITDVNEGDGVIIFGEKPSIEALARVNNTIPYEIISRISSRVKRIYLEE